MRVGELVVSHVFCARAGCLSCFLCGSWLSPGELVVSHLDFVVFLERVDLSFMFLVLVAFWFRYLDNEVFGFMCTPWEIIYSMGVCFYFG